jgi:hypothetical protein
LRSPRGAQLRVRQHIAVSADEGINWKTLFDVVCPGPGG